MKLVVVKFCDPTTFSGQWSSVEEVDQSRTKVCFAAGWLMEENIDCVKVALMVSEDKEEVNSWVVIERGCVLSVDEIREVEWECPL